MRLIVAAKSAETNARAPSRPDMGTSILRTALFLAAAAGSAIAVEAGALDSWVLLGDRDHTHMSGRTEDIARAREVGGSGPALYVRRDGHEWVIRDAKMLARVRALMAPLDELGKKQQPLGELEGVWGRQMRELSTDPEHNAGKMEALGKQMERVGKQMEQIGKQMERAAHVMEDKLGALFDEARAAGLARPIS
jgi:hypothetical protein